MNVTTLPSPGHRDANDEFACWLLTELVRIESFSGSEAKASGFLIEQMSELAFEESYQDSVGNAIGIRNPTGFDTTVVLLGHIDTVPGTIPVRVENGRLFGRGSVDAKGSFAAFAIAGSLCALPSNIRLVVAGAVEEEAATSKGARQIANDFSADYCVIGEPSGASGITLGYKGRLLIKFQIAVEEAHTAGPLPSAAELGADHWFRLRQYAGAFNAGIERVFDQLQLNLREFNTSCDGLTQRADLRVGCRLPVDFDVDALKHSLKYDQCTDSRISFGGYEPAHRSLRSGPLVSSFAAAIRQEFGTSAQFKHKTGTSDMNVVAPVWKCPILAYGPGDSALDHTPNEHLSLTEYVQSIQVLKNAIEQLSRRITPSA